MPSGRIGRTTLKAGEGHTDGQDEEAECSSLSPFQEAGLVYIRGPIAEMKDVSLHDMRNAEMVSSTDHSDRLCGRAVFYSLGESPLISRISISILTSVGDAFYWPLYYSTQDDDFYNDSVVKMRG